MDWKGLDWYGPNTRISEESDMERIFLNIFMNDPGTNCQNMRVKLADDVKLGGTIYIQEDQSALQEEWHSSGELNHSNRMQEQMPKDWKQQFLL